MSKDVFSLLLRDAGLLLQPKKVAEVSSNYPIQASTPASDESVDLLSNPSLNVLRVLSDLKLLFTSETKGPGKSETHASLKLRFYAAHVVIVGNSTGHRAFAILSDALKRRAERVEMEGLVVEDDTAEIRIH